MKKVRVGTPMTVGDTTIVLLEQVVLYSRSVRNVFFACASKEPVGLVVSSSQGKWVMNLDGEQVSLETFGREIDGLERVLEGM